MQAGIYCVQMNTQKVSVKVRSYGFPAKSGMTKPLFYSSLSFLRLSTEAFLGPVRLTVGQGQVAQAGGNPLNADVPYEGLFLLCLHYGK